MGSFPELKFFKVNWRSGADRIIVMFSDEYAQSFLVPRVDTNVVTDALQSTPNLKFYAFAERNSRAWDSYATAGNGTVFELSRNQQQMYDDLMSILDEICLSSSTDQGASRNNRLGFFPASLGVQYNYKLGICY